eukprot:4982905-Pleurochrysis_carterae.AAC.3
MVKSAPVVPLALPPPLPCPCARTRTCHRPSLRAGRARAVPTPRQRTRGGGGARDICRGTWGRMSGPTPRTDNCTGYKRAVRSALRYVSGTCYCPSLLLIEKVVCYFGARERAELSKLAARSDYRGHLNQQRLRARIRGALHAGFQRGWAWVEVRRRSHARRIIMSVDKFHIFT